MSQQWREFAARMDAKGLSPVAIHTAWHKQLRGSCGCVDIKAAVSHLEKVFGSPIDFGKTPFDIVSEQTYKELLNLAEGIASGRVNPDSLESAMLDILGRGHYQAHLAGQEMSGYDPSQIMARRRAREVVQAQVSYIRGFALALAGRDSRYWDEEAKAWKADAIAARTSSYLGRTRGTATDGFVSISPSGALYDWNLGAVELHCEECPILAASGPYLKSEDTGQLDHPTLFTKPGECDTPCLYNCKCFLTSLASGAVGPQPFNFQESDNEIAA